jgi:hypothetical protein
MKIQIKKQEDKASEGFKRGDLLEGFRDGVYLCTDNQLYNFVDVVVINPENEFEHTGKPLDAISIGTIKGYFTGEITLSND